MKFLLPEAAALQVEAWADQRMIVDPHADPELGKAYRTTTLYLDTAEQDVFHRRGSYRRRKFRVRRYGMEPRVYLERKARSAGRVWKKRCGIAETDLLRLTAATDPGWDAFWFHRCLATRRLAPSCLIRYERTAFVGTTTAGPVRLTLDRHLHCAPTVFWQVQALEPGFSFLRGQAILELKFTTALPALFKALLHDMRLAPGSVSKYRLGIEAPLAKRHSDEVG
jgi:hypothetical protein